DSSGSIQCAITTEISTYAQTIEATNAFPLDQWTHVAVVMDGREGILYINGKAIAVNDSVNLLPSDIGGSRNNFGKSQYTADPYFAGLMSDFWLDSDPLTPEQILALQPTRTTISVAAAEGGLILSWPLSAGPLSLFTTTNLTTGPWALMAVTSETSNNT